jgi:hypothetical protein
MARLAALMAGPILLLAVAQAVARQDAGGLLRAAFVHLPLAMLLAFVAVKLVDTAVTVTDVLGRAVAGGAAADAHRALAAVGGIVVQGSLGAGAGAPMFIGLVIGAVVVFAALLLWVELVLRAAAIYVAVLFLPLALAAFIWPATAHWCRRLAETLAALVLAKFVVVAVLALGFSAFQAGALGRLGGGPDALVPGASLLLLAAFAPYMLLRLIPMVEVGALAHLEGHSRRVVGSAGRAAWSAARRATAPSPAEGPELMAQEPRIGTAPGVRPAVVPLHGEDDGAASAALDQEAPLGSGGPEGQPREPRPRDARGDPHLDVHFPGRPSFRTALEQLGGLDVAPDGPLGSEFAVDPPFEPGHEDGQW